MPYGTTRYRTVPDGYMQAARDATPFGVTTVYKYKKCAECATLHPRVNLVCVTVVSCIQDFSLAKRSFKLVEHIDVEWNAVH